MSGRNGKGNGRGGRGKNDRSGLGRGRGQNYTGTSKTQRTGLCKALDSNVFDYGHKAAADQMRTSWEKLVQYVGTTYGQDISNELHNKTVVVLPEPAHTAAVLTRHAARVQMIRTGQANLQQARRAQKVILQAAVQAGNDPEAPMKLAILNNAIAEGDFELNMEVPIDLTDSEKTQHNNEWRTYRDRNAKLSNHRGQAFSLILGQCTQLLQDRMKQDTDYTRVSTSYDPLLLYRLIEKTILAQTEDQYPFATVYDQEASFYSFRQEQMSNPQWYERFNTKVDVGEAIGVTRQHKVLLEYVAQELHQQTFASLTSAEQQIVRTDAEERYIAYAFLRQSGAQHSNLKMDLQNDYTTGDNRYPKNRQQTLHLLDKYSKTIVPKASQSEGSSFAQKTGKGKTGKSSKGKDPTSGQSKTFDKEYWRDKKCFKCDKLGHPATHCPNGSNDDDDAKSRSSQAKSVKKLEKEVKSMKKAFAQLKESKEESDISDSDSSEENSHFQFANDGFQFTQVEHEFEPKIAQLFKQAHCSRMKLDLREIILLDSQSTMDLICNPALVKKIFRSGTQMQLKSNGGSMTVTHKAKMAGYHSDVWYNKKAITNILALSNVIKQYRVTYDSDDRMFVVHRKAAGKPNMEFRMHESGLHFYDPRGKDFNFVNTVSGNKEGFTQRQIKDAEVARTLYATLSYPSWKDFKWVIRSNQIKDCPVTVQDVDNALKIWGKNIAALKGKTTRSKPNPVTEDFVKVPTELLQLHKEVFLTFDIFFVNKIPFFLTLSRKICFTAVNHLMDRTVPEIFKAFKEIYQYYLHRGFRITTVHADGEFSPLKTLIESIPGGPMVNLASRNEHVPEIERRIRVVKERSRATRHSLPFKRLPKLLTIHIVFHAVKLLNFFPTRGGISDTLSPKTIMSGETLDYKKHLCLQIGQYCQVHEEVAPRNSMNPRTKGAIALGPSGNLQGGFKFMALDTGKKIIRRSWDVIPMPDLVIDRVNTLGGDQPEQLTFTDRHGRLIGDTDDVTNPNDDILNPTVDDSDIPGVDIVELPGVDMDKVVEDTAPTITEIDDLDIPTPSDAMETITDGTVEPTPVAQPISTQDETRAPTLQPIKPQDEPRRSTRNRTQTKAYAPSFSGSRYSYAVTQLQYEGLLHPDAHMFVQDDFYQAEPDVVAAVMTQLSLKNGLKEWGDEAYEAAVSEMKQLHFRKTFEPLHWRQLSDIQRKTVLESHMFLKQKRDGKIKGRTVAGGNKQRDYISKEDASSPTVTTESVLLSCIIDAQEGRDVAVIDIPNAFIQTRIEDEGDMAIIKLRGVLVDILVTIAPDVYKSYASTDRKGIRQLVVRCKNALYGTMVASLLFYRKFTKSLTGIGFELNPYDPCVANKMIEGKQMTICFHVDDCKLSHRDSKVLDRMILWLRQEYESIFEDGSGEMKVSRGKVHKYLGMTLDFTERGIVKISMFEYVEEILATFDKADPKGGGTKTSAAPEDLFKIDQDCEKLGQNRAVEFHNLVAKTLFATKRARPDTCTSISFLTTRVRAPDRDDWKKLVHLMKYLRGTRKMPLILSADGSGILKWWVDASFAVHPNMRGHSGGGLSMGRGFPIVSSTKQKLNTRSSTETEIVGADDFMPAICWTRYFLEAQGYQVHDNVLFQDNRSAILLEKNGKASSSKRTKHINIRYFFITDRVSKGDLSLAWCPTTAMIGDFMTKPLQGASFRKFRDLIMGVVSTVDKQITDASKNQDTSFGLVRQERRHHRSVLNIRKVRRQDSDPG
jgi:Reverse transcriptase (RNA-dependent DNA polymerase)